MTGLQSNKIISALLLIAGLAFLTGCPVGPGGGNPSPSSPPETTASYTVYFYNADSWAAVNAYAWSGSGSSVTKHLGDWPGTAMADLGEKWFSIEVPGVAGSNIIFNNGSGIQTADLSRTGDGSWYKGAWYPGDLRTVAPQISVDFGSSASSSPVYLSEAPDVNIEILPASGLTAESLYGFYHEGVLITGSEASLSSGSATADLAAAMAAIPDGESVELRIAAVSGVGPANATYAYVCETSAPAGYTDDPDNDAGTASDPWMPLGAYTSGGNTYFRIWSPDNPNVTVAIDGGADQAAALMPAFGIYKNIYEYHTTGIVAGTTQYQFKIGGIAVRDPYGLMIDNSTHRNVVMDMSGGDTGTQPALANREDSIIYEVHVRDFTINAAGWGGTSANSGKFMGMVQTGTTLNSGGITKTGIDHLVELGVTHVQLLPVYDFGSGMYNWGYDPVNYNIPEEQYSASPTGTASRVNEFRAMVKGFHDNGLRMIMDVVYNHTQDGSTFSRISSKYYTANDLSGCGNSLNTAEPMVSRMIRDSLDQWVGNYGVDGFRFDLLGVFHVAAVNDWGTYLNAKYPARNLLLYGEPWNGFAADSGWQQKVRYRTIQQLTSTAHVGAFGGEFRDNIKGSTDSAQRGYVQGDIGYKAGVNGIGYGLNGSPFASATPSEWDPQFTGDPEQVINYASAHDNYCLWDKILYSNGHSVSTADQADRNMAKFALGILLVSQGIPFIHAGDEFLRTKTVNGTVDITDGRVKNSYNAGDSFNMIHWDWKSTNSLTFTAVRDMIALRKATAAFRQTTTANVNSNQTVSPDYSTGVISVSIGSTVRYVLNPQTGSTATYTGVDWTWTKSWASAGTYGFAAGSSETIPASSMAVYTK